MGQKDDNIEMEEDLRNSHWTDSYPNCYTQNSGQLGGGTLQGDIYKKQCKGVTIDVYDVLKAFDVTNPALAHAVKKILMTGRRGYKDFKKDAHGAIEAICRAIELEDSGDGV